MKEQGVRSDLSGLRGGKGQGVPRDRRRLGGKKEQGVRSDWSRLARRKNQRVPRERRELRLGHRKEYGEQTRRRMRLRRSLVRAHGARQHIAAGRLGIDLVNNWGPSVHCLRLLDPPGPELPAKAASVLLPQDSVRLRCRARLIFTVEIGARDANKFLRSLAFLRVGLETLRRKVSLLIGTASKSHRLLNVAHGRSIVDGLREKRHAKRNKFREIIFNFTPINGVW